MFPRSVFTRLHTIAISGEHNIQYNLVQDGCILTQSKEEGS